MTLTGESQDRALLRAQAEAAAWIAVLHSPERNTAIETGLKTWIAASPLHAAAWETATDLWNETAALPRRIPRQRIPRERRRLIYKPALVLAALCLIGAFGFIQYSLRSTVSTAVGEQRLLNLDDGTRVELNTDTRLRVSFDRSTRTVVLESGEAYFQVTHERRPFIVVAGERKIVALGTAFTVRRDESATDGLTVTLLEGRVAVAPSQQSIDPSSPAQADVTILTPGQRLRARPKARPTVDTPSIDKATGWMRGQLIFDHTPLREAAAEFSRYNKIKITVASPQVADIPIGGIFRIGDSRSFARAVAASYDLKVTVHGDEVLLEPAEGDPSRSTETPQQP
jgi:transmembrane sensor